MSDATDTQEGLVVPSDDVLSFLHLLGGLVIPDGHFDQLVDTVNDLSERVAALEGNGEKA